MNAMTPVQPVTQDYGDSLNSSKSGARRRSPSPAQSRINPEAFIEGHEKQGMFQKKCSERRLGAFPRRAMEKIIQLPPSGFRTLSCSSIQLLPPLSQPPLPWFGKLAAPYTAARGPGHALMGHIRFRELRVNQRPTLQNHPGVQILFLNMAHCEELVGPSLFQAKTGNRSVTNALPESHRSLLTTRPGLTLVQTFLFDFGRVNAVQTDCPVVYDKGVSIDHAGMAHVDIAAGRGHGPQSQKHDDRSHCPEHVCNCSNLGFNSLYISHDNQPDSTPVAFHQMPHPDHDVPARRPFLHAEARRMRRSRCRYRLRSGRLNDPPPWGKHRPSSQSPAEHSAATIGLERTFDPLRDRTMARLQTRGPRALTTPAHPGQARLEHQTNHPFAAQPAPLGHRLGMHPRRPVGATRGLVEGPDAPRNFSSRSGVVRPSP